MIARRDFLMGGACVAAAGAAYALKPKRNVPLLGDNQLVDIVPATFGPWTSQDVGDPLAINGEGTLAAKIYNQLVVRLYGNQETGSQVMMLLAYGGRQTDDLQLHRPEVCYPAFGYTLERNETAELALSRGVTLPARRLIGRKERYEESVLYWTRIGETVPVDAAEQRRDRFRTALSGIIPDGILSRFSSMPPATGHAWSEIESFVPQLVGAIAPQNRRVLIGTQRAAALQTNPA
jgi:EpsI family protein